MNLVLLISIVAKKKGSDSLGKFSRLEGRTMTWIGSGPLLATELAFIDCLKLS